MKGEIAAEAMVDVNDAGVVVRETVEAHWLALKCGNRRRFPRHPKAFMCVWHWQWKSQVSRLPGSMAYPKLRSSSFPPPLAEATTNSAR